jgi:hypothetical protein
MEFLEKAENGLLELQVQHQHSLLRSYRCKNQLVIKWAEGSRIAVNAFQDHFLLCATQRLFCNIPFYAIYRRVYIYTPDYRIY